MRFARPLFALLLLVAVSATAAAPFPTLDYKHRTLPNGLDVYTVQDRSTPTVSIQVIYRGKLSEPMSPAVAREKIGALMAGLS